jgi:hypothetical protein
LTVSSGVTAFIPTATIEYNFISGNFAKVFLGVGAGYATVKFSNDYVMTDAGDTQYFGGVGDNDYSIAASGSGIEAHAALGAEILAVDNVTISMDIGYRMLEISKFKYTNDATIISGSGSAAVANGETVLETTGKRKTIDLSGAFVGISFRFYLPPFR